MSDVQWIIEGLKQPGKTQSGLAKALGRAPSAITALLQGRRELKAREVDVIRKYLASEAAAPMPIVQEVIPAPDKESPLDRLGPNTLPILGITMGGRSDKRGPDFWMNGEVVRYAPRPRRLEGQKDVFGLYVDGTSMEPRYYAKDLVVVERTTPAPGDDVVIELKSTDPADEHDNPSFIKQFVGRRGSTITVRQFNPKKELTFDLKEIKNLFRVIPVKELMA